MSRTITWFLAVLSLVALFSSGASCATTEGKIVIVRMHLRGTAANGSSIHRFTTSTGWDVTLERAFVAMGPVYVYAPAGDLTAALQVLLLPRALAHGGFDPLNGRRVRAELLDQVALDLLSDDGQTFDGIEAEAGVVDAVSLALEPPNPENSERLSAHHFWARGTATQGTMTIPFEGGLDIPDDGLARRIEGVPIEGTLDEGGSIEVGVVVSSWFDDAHFERLAEPSQEGRFLVTPQSQVHAAWFLNVRSVRSYMARWSPRE